MMSLQIASTRLEHLHWPAACAMCGAQADNHATASIVANQNYQYNGVQLRWTKHTSSILYPVCRKHRVLCRLINVLPRIGLFGLVFLPAIAVSVSMSFIVTFTDHVVDAYIIPLAAIFYGSMVIFYVASIMLQPVHLSAIDDASLTIIIRNKKYFDAFRRLNAMDNPRR